jgi:hypothetical protein
VSRLRLDKGSSGALHSLHLSCLVFEEPPVKVDLERNIKSHPKRHHTLAPFWRGTRRHFRSFCIQA